MAGLREKALRIFDYVRTRSVAYRVTFLTPAHAPAAQVVLRDLAKFCRANETTFNADPRAHAVLEGRREVWLRIANHLNLNTEQLYAIYTGNSFHIEEDKNG